MVNFSNYNLNNLTGSPDFSFNLSAPLNISFNISEQLNWSSHLINGSNATLMQPVEKLLIIDTQGFGLFAVLLSFIGMVWFKTKSLASTAAVAMILASGLTIADLSYNIVNTVQMVLMWAFVLAFAGLLYLLYKER